MSVEVIQLPRGGTVLKTPAGLLQVGATPETIKDSMKLLGEVPDSFVLPNKLFSAERGVSLADIEFPAYYNYFLKNRPIKVIGQSHQIETILGVLKEAVLGPDAVQVAREFPYGTNRDLIPDLRAEMEFLRAKDPSGRRRMELSDIAVGIPWGPSNRVPLGGMALERTAKGMVRVVEGATVLAEVPLDVTFGPPRAFPQRQKPFEPPLFGVTVIGSGSGFDPKEMTSGFILWVNRRGVLVDPPVDSTLWLKAMDINPRLIDDCILTHCHADHDSGILQKLLEEKKINLYTTETIMESFLRKYRSLTGLSQKTFMGLFHFHPVTLGVPIRIHGGEFRFFYTLHSVPTIGLEVYFQGKSFVYSSDSLYDPPTVRRLHEMGIINRYRMIELINFPWHHTVIFHEAGMPPLHTPIKNLADLPDAVQERLYLIHVSEKAIPPNSRMRKAPDGPDETIVIPVNPPPSNEALEYLDVLNHIDLFSGLPIEKAREFLTLVKVERFAPGDVFIRRGTIGDRFYMIVNGRANVVREGQLIKTYTNNDYIGETSMILNAPRNADVIAESDLKVLVMEKYDFLYFIRGTEIARQMKIIAENREYNTWALFDDTPLLKGLSPTQRTQLQGIMTRLELPAGKTLVREGADRECFHLVDAGTIAVTRRGRTLGQATRGSLIAKIYANPVRGRHRFTLTTTSAVVVYTIDVFEFYRFLERNPGVFLLLREARVRQQIVWAP
ncbi:MAG: cyclic nucleotide-binding protein [Candidatus Ozemobacter sibiricus]|jgi:CRP-like cAMP-binding protein/phosphoribosyl 1,2-cyclic phosphodiesterase|uniref:Cyclic nucleotide-binding protein n=1 Tax=Candidatus Ozemobacter sibiricus TaxID=2268124 RepID=A0A367ZLK4_9BACT|nr:MAG: cyclic nucleotide-binding protein [Candidatus Ozemobacter sibiricus]